MITVPSVYGSTRKEKHSGRGRLLEFIPLDVQVSALAATFLVCAFLSGLDWSSPSAVPGNLLANPAYKLSYSTKSYVLECRGAARCGPSPTAASSWDIRDTDGGGAPLWATTDRVPSTLGHGDRWMLHVTGSRDVMIQQAGTFSAAGADWSVWAFPVMGEVKACVGPVGHRTDDPLSCDTTTASGSWQELSGAYVGRPADGGSDQFSIEGIAAYPSGPTPYTDFYVANASVNKS
jgi:hypothetical protein